MFTKPDITPENLIGHAGLVQKKYKYSPHLHKNVNGVPMKLSSYLNTLILSATFVPFAMHAAAEKVQIAVGHQSMCTDTYTAGIVVKELGLLEKYLPTDGDLSLIHI